MPQHSLSKQYLSSLIKTQAKSDGFFDCGISKAEYLKDDATNMEEWLSQGYNGEMGYLKRNKEKRYNPVLLVENAKSVITVLYNYYSRQNLSKTDNYKISRYAYGEDYHYVIKDKLHKLLGTIKEKVGNCNARVFVDSAPVLDRAWARRSGLGFVGKNTLIINKKGGSFFFIGHIIIDLELQYENDVDPLTYCGSCTKCIDACPTSAIKENYVDARSCLSYLTIEYTGELPMELKDRFNDWVFGCDICQDVCPWNRFSSPHEEPLFEPSENLLNMRKPQWKEMGKPEFNNLFKNSAVQRTGYFGLKRNIDFLK
ncbi:MAG: tRNA epoxyqueuosine(34) reductase QueG [Bacteroidetes bacterium]|jgi:epoxyqueuosine reductase|nr:tRNA epoxyqueuosine(34) reductase QueG [Bacteroidota bacterium]|tara:strand:+ start:32 stop:970 length:939 start_codon:yes stop_codon:yes gene_type:complete